MLLTYKRLVEKRACLKQRRKFRRLFGKSVNVTVRLCIKHSQDFDFTWAAGALLSYEQQKDRHRHLWRLGKKTHPRGPLYLPVEKYWELCARAFALAYNKRRSK